MSKATLSIGLATCASGLVLVGFFWLARSYFSAIAQGAVPQEMPLPAKAVEQLACVAPVPRGPGQPAVVFWRCRCVCRTGLILGGLIALSGLYVAAKGGPATADSCRSEIAGS